MVIAATSRPDAIEPALRRCGRFHREIALGIPDEHARMKIIQVMASKLRLAGDFDYARIARNCAGFVGADLLALVTEAAAVAVNRIFHDVITTTIDTSTNSTIAAATDHQEKASQVLQNHEKVTNMLQSRTTLTAEQMAGIPFFFSFVFPLCFLSLSLSPHPHLL